jgi:hypothetical protein
VVVRVQMLSELEEIITYKQNADQPDRQATIRNTWMRRYAGMICPFQTAYGPLQIEGVPIRR